MECPRFVDGVDGHDMWTLQSIVRVNPFDTTATEPDEKREWGLLLEKYLTQRSNLAGLVLIMDARRPFTPLDRQMISWFAPTGKPIHCLLTKADKLTRQEQVKTLRAANAEAAGLLGNITLQLFSSLKKTGMDEAEAAIGAWLDHADILQE